MLDADAATASNKETATMGLPNISASALIAANPTRNPVKDPGPEATAKASKFCFTNPYLDNKDEICGTSWAENVPPFKGTTSNI
jgi:hypothetical protein